jgi:hypothetical protein
MCFMYLAMLMGAIFLTVVSPPGSLLAFMPHPVVMLWAVAMFGSGLAGMIGCTRQALAVRDPDPLHSAKKLLWGLVVERVAVGVQAGALLIILVAIIYGWWTLPPTSHVPFPTFGAGFISAWMIANIWRDRQISTDVRKIQTPPPSGE